MDYINYSLEHNQEVILAITEEEYIDAQRAYVGRTHTETCLRDYEPTVLVHSTTPPLWHKIRTCGCLKSWNVARREGLLVEVKPIGDALGDPCNYSDYVMLSSFGYFNEIVVACKQKGQMIYDPNQQYTPGARIFFDATKIAAAGLLVRDGLHLKVRHTLPLEYYMIWVATPDELEIQGEFWTPLSFTSLADNRFRALKQ